VQTRPSTGALTTQMIDWITSEAGGGRCLAPRNFYHIKKLLCR
jgi:hypothetical protein